MKNTFYFILKTLVDLKILKFLSLVLDLVQKRLDQTDKVNFKVYDVTTWEINISYGNIAQYLKK